MDALAGYESDSSSPSGEGKDGEDGRVSHEVNETLFAPSGDKSSELSSILGPGMDSSSEDEDDARGGENTVASNFQQSSTTSSNAPCFPNDLDVANRKRPRIDDKWISLLPTPTTSSDSNGEQSMIMWNADYLFLPPSSSNNEIDGKVDISATRAKNYPTFEKLVATLPHGTSWAKHLQEQQEFHNPHFFRSVVEYFGISQPLGSQLD
jgi:hypothetical protein